MSPPGESGFRRGRVAVTSRKRNARKRFRHWERRVTLPPRPIFAGRTSRAAGGFLFPADASPIREPIAYLDP